MPTSATKPARGQIAYKPAVGCQKVVAGQIFELGPAHLLKDAVHNLPGELVHREELQVDCAAMAVIVANVRDAAADGGLDAKFLVQFAGQGLFGAFARLNLAAGKLAALPNQDLGAAHNQCGRDKSQRGTGGARIGIRQCVFHTSIVNAPSGMQRSSGFKHFGAVKTRDDPEREEKQQEARLP